MIIIIFRKVLSLPNNLNGADTANFNHFYKWLNKSDNFKNEKWITKKQFQCVQYWTKDLTDVAIVNIIGFQIWLSSV